MTITSRDTALHPIGSPSAMSADRLVRGLALAVFLQWFGASAIIPMLPEYIRHRGGSDSLAGLVMAAFFAAGVLFQYPAGRVADRVGRRPVLLAGLALYAVASFGFLAPIGPAVDIGLRALQGIGAGAAEVAALAMVSAAVNPDRRGKAFASIYGGQVAGMAVGPLIGSVLGVNLMWMVFVAAGVTSLAACLPALSIVEVRVLPDDRDPDGLDALHSPIRLSPALIGSLMASVVLGLTFGVYEICWTLLLKLRGASGWEIGLSWTLFAVPFVLMTRPSGWLTDHLNRKYLVMAGLTLAMTMCGLYPFLHSVPLLVGLGAAEAVGIAIVLPAVQSLLAQTSDPSQFGRVQGMFSTCQIAAAAVAAAAAGALLGVGASWPFVITAVTGASILVVIPLVWRSVAGVVPR
ncbi:MAG TPA: MFS transporter [Acidimicrobiales bacterium]|jgi:DHA1 family multidrug resistance protein-like MFS transporter|nr:MFS transporter [Acidimicrobiales bacterium]